MYVIFRNISKSSVMNQKVGASDTHD